MRERLAILRRDSLRADNEACLSKWIHGLCAFSSCSLARAPADERLQHSSPGWTSICSAHVADYHML